MRPNPPARRLSVSVALLSLLVLAACGSTSHPAKTALPNTALPNTAPPGSAVTTSSAAWSRVADILNVMHTSAFNVGAPAAGTATSATAVVPGGLFINWRPGFVAGADAGPATNVNENGLSDAQAGRTPRHDPLTDLVYLVNLTGWRYAHPTDHTYDGDISRLEPIVAAEFANYRYYRGYVYFELLDLDRYDPGHDWAGDAHRLATSLAGFWDPTDSQLVDPRHHAFTSDDSAESAAALVDAGKRFATPKWSEIGLAAALHLVTVTANPVTGLVPEQVNVTGSSEQIANPQALVGAEAQILDSLLDVYDLVGDKRLLSAVEKAVTSFYDPNIGVYDPTHGGFYFAVNVDGSNVNRAYKETRQAWMLPLLEHLNTIDHTEGGRITAMLTVVRDQLWQPGLQGYLYRVAPDFSVYVNHQGPGRSPVPENFITSEAMGIAGQALEGLDLRV